MPPSSVTRRELDLVERARAGDARALDELLRRHERRIYRFGLRMCGEEEAAREVLQRTLLTAFEQLSTFRGDARLSTWLYTIARTFCVRQRRRTRSAPLHDLELDAPGGEGLLPPDERANPDEAAERNELAGLVATAMGALPVEQREAVVLRDVEGLSADEAAAVIGVGVAALKSRLHRGREELRKNLAALVVDENPAVGRPCERLAARLEELAARDVDQAACAVIEDHVRGCPTCAKGLGQLRQAASLCRRLPSGSVPGAVRRAVRAALLKAIGSGHPRLKPPRGGPQERRRGSGRAGDREPPSVP